MDMGSTGVKFSGGKIVPQRSNSPPFGSPGGDYFRESMAGAQNFYIVTLNSKLRKFSKHVFTVENKNGLF